jgi:hypothetical protein
MLVLQEIGYPNNSFDNVGPRPSNFSVGACSVIACSSWSCTQKIGDMCQSLRRATALQGRRALDFVLKNQVRHVI